VFCSKHNGKSMDDLMSVLLNVKEYNKDLNITSGGLRIFSPWGSFLSAPPSPTTPLDNIKYFNFNSTARQTFDCSCDLYGYFFLKIFSKNYF
jgi:hypothetical protein